MKKILAAVLSLLVAMIVVWSWQQHSTPKAIDSTLTTQSVAHNSGHTALHDYAVKGRVPAYQQLQSELSNLPPTLPPEAFSGNKRLAYQAARDIPETLAQLPCYCHCDRSQNHMSLHSCFESEHGENCGICINEALMAHSLRKQGLSVVEIRNQIIATFGED